MTSAPTTAPVQAPARFSRRERRSIAGMTGFVALLHVLGWGVLVLAVAPREYQLGSTGVLGVGVGLTAYLLGVRHAFDADHIASIHNATRRLVGEGKPSVSAGFWFSLGLSSVVFAASLLLVAGVHGNLLRCRVWRGHGVGGPPAPGQRVEGDVPHSAGTW